MDLSRSSFVDSIEINQSNDENLRQFRPFHYIILGINSIYSENFFKTYKDDYKWRISLWKDSDTRLSLDADLSYELQGNNAAIFFEIYEGHPDAQLFVSVVHRDTGVIVGSGSLFIDLSSDDCSAIRSGVTVSTDIVITNNAHDMAHACPELRQLTFSAVLSSLVTLQRLREGAQLMPSDEMSGLASQPHLLSELRPFAHSDLELCTMSNALLAVEDSLQFLSLSHRSGQIVSQQSVAQDQRTLDTWTHQHSRYYVTVEDIQLAPDILDLYAAWNLLVSAHFCPSLESPASSSTKAFLGHIRSYEGNWTSKTMLWPFAGDDAAALVVEVSIAEAVTQRHPAKASVSQNILCSGMLNRGGFVSQEEGLESHSHSSCLLRSGQYEVVLYTDLSREFDSESVASNSSIRQRIFVGRAMVQLNVIRPDSVGALSHTGRSESKSKNSATGALQNVFRACSELVHLESHFVALQGVKYKLQGSAISAVDQQEQANHKAQKRALLSCLALGLGTLSFCDADTRRQVTLRVAEEMRRQGRVAKGLSIHFEDWLTSELLNEIMTRGASALSISTVKTLSQTDSQFHSSIALQLSALIGFGGDSVRSWEAIRAAFFQLQLLGSVFRTTNFPGSSAPVLVDYEYVCDVSQDLLIALLGHCSSVLDQYTATMVAVNALDSAYQHCRVAAVTSVLDCLHCVVLVAENIGVTSLAVEKAFAEYSDAVLPVLEEALSISPQLPTIPKVWQLLVATYSLFVAGVELGIHKPRDENSLCYGILCLHKHITAALATHPDLSNAVNASAIIVNMVDLMTSLSSVVQQQTEWCAPVAESDTAALSQSELDAEFEFSGILRHHLVDGELKESRQFQVPDHPRRKNYKPSSNVTFAVEGLAKSSFSVADLNISSMSPLSVSSAGRGARRVGSVFTFEKQSSLHLDTDSVSESSMSAGNPVLASISPRSSDNFSSASGFSSANGGTQEVIEGPFCGELLLTFLHDNHAYLDAVHALLELVLLFQRSDGPRVGVRDAMRVVESLASSLLNSLFKGRETNKNIVQRVYEALSGIAGPSSSGLLCLVAFLAQYDVHRDSSSYSLKEYDKVPTSDTLLRVQQQVSSYSNYLTILYTKLHTDSAMSRSAVLQYRLRRENGSEKAPSHSIRLIDLWLTARRQLLAALRTQITHVLHLLRECSDVSSADSRVADNLLQGCLVQFVSFACNLSFMKHVVDSRGDVVQCLYQFEGIADTVRLLFGLALAMHLPLRSDNSGNSGSKLLDKNRDNLLLTVLKTVVMEHTADPTFIVTTGTHEALKGVFMHLVSSSTLAALESCEDLGFVETAMQSRVGDYLCCSEQSVHSELPLIPSLPSAHTTVLIALARLFTCSTSVTGERANDLGLAFRLHMLYIRQLVTAKLSLRQPLALLDGGFSSPRRQHDTLLMRAALAHLMFSAFSRDISLASVSLSNGSAAGSKNTVSNLQAMVDELHRAQDLVGTSGTARDGVVAVSSDLLQCAGVSHKAALHFFRLLVLQATRRLGDSPVTDAAEQTETEIAQLRSTLRYCLGAGLWEQGVKLAQLFLDKYKHITGANAPTGASSPAPSTLSTSAPFSPLRSALVGSSSGKQLRKMTFDSFYGDLSQQQQQQQQQQSPAHSPSKSMAMSSTPSKPSPTSTVALLQSTMSPKRSETIRSELLRTIDKLQDQVKANDHLRLFPIHYAIRFISDIPWDRAHLENRPELHRLLARVDVEGFNLTSTQWFNHPDAAAQRSVEYNSSSYDYWLVLRFDMTANTAAAQFYKDYLLDCERRKESGLGSSEPRVSLLSPISHQHLQRQISTAFPEFLQIPSHHAVESYITKKHSLHDNGSSEWGSGSGSSESKTQGSGLPCCTAMAHSCKYMQLFQAFPAIISSEIHDAAHLAQSRSREDKSEAGSEGGEEDEDEKEGETEDDEANKVTTSLDLDELLASVSKTRIESIVDNVDDCHFLSAQQPTSFWAYAILSEEEVLHRKQLAATAGLSTEGIAAQYINRFELSLDQQSVSFAAVGTGNNATTSVDESQDVALLGVALSPLNFAVHTANTPVSIATAGLEVLHYYKIVLMRAYKAVAQLNQFSLTEIEKEPTNDLASSLSVFVGVFTLLSNVLGAPNISYVGLHNMESIIAGERERLLSDWQTHRKLARRAYQRELQVYEEALQKTTSLMARNALRKPEELDTEALQAQFDLQAGHEDIDRLETLRSELMVLVDALLSQMRKFSDKVKPKNTTLTQEEIRNAAISKGRRPTVANQLMFSKTTESLVSSKRTGDEGEASREHEEAVDDERTLKAKLCLFLESLFAAVEIGIAL